MSHAGMSRRNFREETALALVSSFFGLFIAAPILFVIAALVDPTSGAMSSVSVLAASSATLLCFAVLVLLRMPGALRISFAPVVGPGHVRVVRWWRTRRIPVSALSGITIIEYRYRRSRETAAGDAQRETISTLPYRIDAVLHRVTGGSWTVRGKTRPGMEAGHSGHVRPARRSARTCWPDDSPATQLDAETSQP
jgi:hypothetical protein